MTEKYALGLDYGTNSVRALIVETHSGEEIGTAVWGYAHGEAGIVLDPRDPDLARQHPRDYIDGARLAIRGALESAAAKPGFSPDKIVGIGVDATGSTPLPVDRAGDPLALSPGFANEPAAMAWLWKDHTAHAEAAEITDHTARLRPQYLAKCGGKYSPEWYWSKILHAKRTAPHVADATYTWVEIADWIPALLTGNTDPDRLKRGICTAGHKAMFHTDWGGYPEADFLGEIDPALGALRTNLPNTAHTIADQAGTLTRQWAERTGLPAGIPVAIGALDAHLGAVGSGVRPGILAKVLGTSACDMTVAPLIAALPDIPGLCGIVPESILPGNYGLEAGQAAVGDIYNWLVNDIRPGGDIGGTHEALTRAASALRPGESGLLALDWHNGNRTVLVDQRLSGLILGLNLHTTPGALYRALIESTAFGARAIIERFQEYRVPVDRVICCGGIALKNPVVMQIFADTLKRPMEVSRSEQTCALGSAMAGAVVGGAHRDFTSASEAMTGVRDRRYIPDQDAAAIYDRLYGLYRKIHDAFGIPDNRSDLHPVMKELLAIRDAIIR